MRKIYGMVLAGFRKATAATLEAVLRTSIR
jgi:hypothetical protein